MKTIQEIIEEVSLKTDGVCWDNLFNIIVSDYLQSGTVEEPFMIDDFIHEVAKRYAEQALDEAAEKAVLHCIIKEGNINFKQQYYQPISSGQHYQPVPSGPFVEVDKNSILNIKKELK